MTPDEHKRTAEDLLRMVVDLELNLGEIPTITMSERWVYLDKGDRIERTIARAQVHATLASITEEPIITISQATEHIEGVIEEMKSNLDLPLGEEACTCEPFVISNPNAFAHKPECGYRRWRTMEDMKNHLAIAEAGERQYHEAYSHVRQQLNHVLDVLRPIITAVEQHARAPRRQDILAALTKAVTLPEWDKKMRN